MKLLKVEGNKVTFGEETKPPDTTTLLGQFVVQQMLENATLKKQLNALGKGIVQVLVKKGV